MTNNKSCSHPNCRLVGNKLHPKSNKMLCESHYVEICMALKTMVGVVTLTCQSNN